VTVVLDTFCTRWSYWFPSMDAIL